MIELSAGADAVDEVHLPDKALWLGEYLGELATFPNGRNDDQVDSTSQGISRFRMDKVEIVDCYGRPCEFCRGRLLTHQIVSPGMAKGMVILNRVPVLLVPSR
jgi:hypothetical protein